MFISNIRTEFYDVIVGNRVLLLVGSDVDALCACRILQFLLHCDNVLYSLISVNGKQSLLAAYNRHKIQTKYVILINCGSTIDIVEYLKPDEEVVFFICDTSRPVDVYNVYSESQIRLLIKPEDDEAIPAFDDIFREDEEDDNENERLDENVILRRRERRLWEENRHKIIFDYTQYSYYGLSSAFLMFDLAWKMSRDTNELLWWAIVGLTEQYITGKIEHDKYILNAATLQNHVARHNHQNDNATGNCVKITFDKELNLYLYRHWSLMESFTHTRYTSCKFKLWTFKGQKRMQEFLAEIGIPLSQCRQKFMSMDMKFRNNLLGWVEDMSEKYKLDDMVYGSFTYRYGFRNKFCAADIVFATNALLESVDKDKEPSDKFLNAIDSLNKTEKELVYKGLEMARHQLVAMFKQVQSFIDMNHIISAGPFLYAIIEDSTPDVRYFSYPVCLTMLAHFLLHAHVNSTKSRKAKSLPLVLMAPDGEDGGKHLVIGIPPVLEGSPKNFFGKAFEQAAERSRISLTQDYFNSSVVSINSNDKSKFFDALISLLS